MIYRTVIPRLFSENILLFAFIVLIQPVVSRAFVAGYSTQPGPPKSQMTHRALMHSETLPNDTLQQQLIAKEKMTWDLAIKRDVASYKALHAPDFFTVSGSGVTDRTHSEASALDQNVSFDHYELSGFVVDFAGKDAALISYRVKAAGFDHGKKFHLDSYATSLWTKRDEKWLNVFYQATPAVAP